METNQGRFEDLLREVFQFDSADLDFGIYRILNRKRAAVEDFITSRLPSIVEQAFEGYRTVEKSTAEASVAEIAARIRETLGSGALDDEGKLVTEFEKLPIGREYADALGLLNRASVAEEIRDRVYNDLFVFFSRFYVDGDFMPKRRYGGKEPYVIPYWGEEVLLHWANLDQYYIKTDELLSAYSFKIPGASVAFVVKLEEDEGTDDEKRYFVLDESDPVEWDPTDNKLEIRFRYRGLSKKERDGLTVAEARSPQDKLRLEAIAHLWELIPDSGVENALRQAGESGRSLLEEHLRRFTRKNTADFFIHRELREFLVRELDFYISNEVMVLGEVLRRGVDSSPDLQIERGHVVRRVAEDVIDFVAQIEGFQKRLFEKRKFVLKTDYVLSLKALEDHAGEHAELIVTSVIDAMKCDPRFRSDLERTLRESYRRPGDGVEVTKVSFAFDERVVHLEYERKGKPYTSPTLTTSVPLSDLYVDTRFVSDELKARLLHALSAEGRLEEVIDGLAIKSDGFHALALLTPKITGSVDLAYIDPPFNTQGSSFLYKDDYRDSTWLSLMRDRLVLARELLAPSGSLYLHLDHNGNYLGRMLLNQIFGPERLQREVIWNTGATHDPDAELFSFKSFGTNWVRQHDTLFFYAKAAAPEFTKLWKPERTPWRDEELGWLDLLSVPKSRPPKRLADFEFYVERWEAGELRQLPVELPEDSKVYAIGDVWGDVFSFMQSELRTTESVGFSTQKPENLLRRIIQAATRPGDLVLDFFAGSGTTLSAAHMLGRRWIGVEMGDQFDDVLLPRMKSVLAGQRRTHLSRDLKWAGGGAFQYHVLEQYEDTLASLEFDEAGSGQTALEAFGDDYILRYMLDFETRESPPIVKQSAFTDPNTYLLNAPTAGGNVSVDLVNTFSLLLGIHVKQQLTFDAIDRTYTVVNGIRQKQKVVTVWRRTDDLRGNDEALLQEKAFLENEVLPTLTDAEGAIIFANDVCLLEGVVRIEPEFGKLMFDA